MAERDEAGEAGVDEHQPLDLGPWWYAPVAAAALASLTLGNLEDFPRPGLALTGAALLTLGVALDYQKRHRDLPPPPKSWKRLVGFGAAFIVLISVWNAVALGLGTDRFVPWWAALAWLATAGLFLGARQLVLSRR